MPRITVIEPTINALTKAPIHSRAKRKVAAYARVSTDSDEQYTSYEAQVEFYTKYIHEREDWEYVNTYADEGISGTSTRSRDAFNQMINDALEGKIDLIITKSISRFARNTLDTISKVRELKAHQVEIYFEKENIWTFDSKSELVMTIMASIAQEESRSISENVKWGKRVAFKKGKVTISYKNFLGYKKGQEGEIEVDEDEARLVRYIYLLFLVEGLTCHAIAAKLNKEGFRTKKDNAWSKNSVKAILTNEKYKGDALLQKGYVENYLDHRTVKNNGVLPKYYVENSHKAIVEKAEWEMVQAELARRESIADYYSAADIFATKLICEDCGKYYGRKVWHSNDAYRRVIYQCNHKFDINKKKKCTTPHLTEEEIIEKFLEAYNRVMLHKEKIVEDLKAVVELLSDETCIDGKLDEVKNEQEVAEALVKVLLEKRSKGEIGEEEFTRQYDDYEKSFDKLNQKLTNLIKEKELIKGKKEKMLSIISLMEKEPNKILVWNKRTWMYTVEKATVHRDKTITFSFYSGQEVRV